MVVKMAKKHALETSLAAVARISYSNFEKTSGLEERSELGGTFELEETSGLEVTRDFAVPETLFAFLGFVLSQNLGTLSSQE